MNLGLHDFDDFWREVHRTDGPPGVAPRPSPFDWQRRLVEHIAKGARWPDVLDVPTGMGKTTVLDIAVFTMALARAGVTEGPLPRRIFLVIDRRVVVDQAFEHATAISTALASPSEGSVCARVAALLRPHPLDRPDRVQESVEREQLPLVVGRMRGGTTWSWRWLDRPDQPAIIVGTVDQLGSRLLFDGYGVGDTLRPIDAALVGSDSLILVDEAHLADAFLRTVADANMLGRGSAPLQLSRPSVVVMSATVPEVVDNPVLLRIDESRELEDPVAAARLSAPKTLVTAEARVTQARRAQETGAALASVARHLASSQGVIGVVANTVAVARAAFSELQRHLGPEADERCILVTGRQRPIDREVVWREWRARIEAGRPEPAEALFVVATQTIEVGADLDFSALVTESASVDALIQRLGRLNRRGERASGSAVVVHPTATPLDDPIYGRSRAHTWAWLVGLVPPQSIGPRNGVVELEGAVDVSPLGIDRLMAGVDPSTKAAMRMARPTIPALFPSILDRWVRTFPRALDSPPTGPFLHGLERDVPSVTLLWRHAGERGLEPDRVRAALTRSVETLPPSPDEEVEVPLWAAEAWLRSIDGVDPGEVADLATSASTPELGRTNGGEVPFVVLESEGGLAPGSTPLRSGSVLVLPTWSGGCDRYGWNPGSVSSVIDIADLAEHRLAEPSTPPGSGRRGHRRVLRLDGQTLLPLVGGDTDAAAAIADALAALTAALDDGDDPREAVASCLDALRPVRVEEGGLGALLTRLIDDLTAAGDQRDVMVSASDLDDDAFSILVHGPGAIERWSTDAVDVGTSLSGQPVTLAQHQRAVASRAEEFARALGLPEALTSAVVLAAAHHDVGKLDPRFQAMLNGGVGTPEEPLAKSGMDPAQRWLFRRASQLAGYPRGMRHEAFSARAVRLAYQDHPEVDLIVHLVASHHGRGRPLEEAVLDDSPVSYVVTTDAGEVELRSADGVDWEQPRRFRQLNARFGPWGLAMLETIVRLADIGCSAEGT